MMNETQYLELDEALEAVENLELILDGALEELELAVDNKEIDEAATRINNLNGSIVEAEEV